MFTKRIVKGKLLRPFGKNTISAVIYFIQTFSDKIEAIYPVVLVTYFIGIIVSLVTNKKGEELA